MAIAALSGWHESHERSRQVAQQAAIPAHAYLETYAVLTRLPQPYRLPAGTAAELLTRWFHGQLLAPPPDAAAVVAYCSARDLLGGATYDALIALAAREAGCTLLTLDARAARTYQQVGVAFELVGA